MKEYYSLAGELDKSLFCSIVHYKTFEFNTNSATQLKGKRAERRMNGVEMMIYHNNKAKIPPERPYSKNWGFQKVAFLIPYI
jgi:hypothetical protein